MVVNRSFVEQILAGGDALGTRFRYVRAPAGREPGGAEAGDWYEIVGMVSDFGYGPSASGRGSRRCTTPPSPEGSTP